MEKTAKTAFLVMDMQLSILSRLADATAIVGNVAKAIEKARSKNIPVIYAVVGFRAGTPEISPNNKSFSAIKNMPEWTLDFAAQFIEIHPGVAPIVDEAIVTKRRVSAFTGSDLEVILRAKGIEHLVLTGVATSGVVLSTLREAADKDYQLTVLSDCCADGDEEVHRVLTTKVFTRQAQVIALADWE